MKRMRENRKRRAWRLERTRIESRLHPCPRIEGVKICHEHLGTCIVFTGWVGDRRVDGKELRVSRADVLSAVDFYAQFSEELRRLVRKESAP
jgi:hypothetical protein